MRSSGGLKVVWDGKTDDTAAMQAAFTAAHNNAFTLVIDCVANLNIGVVDDASSR